MSRCVRLDTVCALCFTDRCNSQVRQTRHCVYVVRFTDRCNNQVCQTKHSVYIVLQTGVTTRCVRLDTVCTFCFTDRRNNQVCQTGHSVCVVFHRQV